MPATNLQRLPPLGRRKFELAAEVLVLTEIQLVDDGVERLRPVLVGTLHLSAGRGCGRVTIYFPLATILTFFNAVRKFVLRIF